MSAKLLQTTGAAVLSKRGQAKPFTFLTSFDRLRARVAHGLPTTEQLLTEGGDARIVSDVQGRNKYGCSHLPEPEVLAFGSSTASTISSTGFAAAQALRRWLHATAAVEPAHITYDRELNRVRRELKQLCGVEKLSGLDIIFGASGTDLHLFASQLMIGRSVAAPLIVRVEASETGKGVPNALAGCHFDDCAALGDIVHTNAPLDCGRPIEIQEVKCRTTDGTIRPLWVIDAEVEQAVTQAATKGRRVLLTIVDVSKTGLLAPSLACVESLRSRFPAAIEVLVDACQFRLAPSTLKSYLEHNYLVAITGSKFVTGPTFCGALFVPDAAARRLRARVLPRALRSYSAQADWPRKWAARAALSPVANFGLLLRWQAALAELRAFSRLDEKAVADFLTTFADAVTQRLAAHPAFEWVAAPALDRSAVASTPSWDQLPTIFSFLLVRHSASGDKDYLTLDETRKVHELLREEGHTPALARSCQLGQPVNCGTRAGAPVSALRLCASTRLIVDALSPKGRGTKAVISDALAVLDKCAALVSLPLI